MRTEAREPPSVAAIMAVYNRAELTRRCLDLFFDGCRSAQVRGQAFVFDDGSTDATPLLLAEYRGGPVHTVTGDGNLFWAASMAVVEGVALTSEASHLLWLNDDVELEAQAIQRLLDVSAQHPTAIVAGALTDTDGRLSYSGAVSRPGPWHFHFSLIPAASTRPLPVEAASGNVLLVPTSVARQLGGIDGRYSHGYADWDYTLRARKFGVPVLLAPRVQGICPANPQAERHLDATFSLRQRLAHARTKKGMPLKDQARFFRAHAGPLWPFRLLASYRKVLWP